MIGQETEEPDPPLTEQKNKFYFQFRLDLLGRNEQEIEMENMPGLIDQKKYVPEKRHFANPRMFIGVARDDFHLDKDLSRHMGCWAMNLETGDKYYRRKWSNYFDNTRVKFLPGSIIGILVDMDRGILNFYLNGLDLGPAFINEELKKGKLYPFV